MIKLIKSKLVISLLACFALQTTVLADGNRKNERNQNSCDVVSLNGSGKLLEDGRIVGKEVLTIIGTDKQIEVEFTTMPLGALNVDQTTGAVTLGASHDFTGVKSRRVNFTTFDEITVVPLGDPETKPDASCQANACGLIFKLKLETGHGRYNCGEIVSGYNTDPSALIPFTSYVDPSTQLPNGDTVSLNSIGKLCKCGGNN